MWQTPLMSCSISRVEKTYYPGLIPVSPLSFACHFGNQFQDAFVYFLGQFSIFCMLVSFRKWMSRGNLHEAFKIQVHLLDTFRCNWVCCPSWGCQCSLGISFRKLPRTWWNLLMFSSVSLKKKRQNVLQEKVSDYMPGPSAKDFDSKNTEALSLQQLGHACNSYLLPPATCFFAASLTELPRATCHAPRKNFRKNCLWTKLKTSVGSRLIDDFLSQQAKTAQISSIQKSRPVTALASFFWIKHRRTWTKQTTERCVVIHAMRKRKDWL